MRVPNRVLRSRHPDQNFLLIAKSRTFLSANPGAGHDVTSRDVQTLYSITTAVDLGYALLVFSTNRRDQIDPTCNCSIRNHSFETQMMHNFPLLVSTSN